MWIHSRSGGKRDPRADGHDNPFAERIARAESITHSRADSITHARAAVAGLLVASRGECQWLRRHG